MPELTTAIQVEPTDPPGVVAERVFLTPRVVDQNAFEDYSTRLRRLLEQVAGAAQTMAQAAIDAGTTHKGLLEASGTQRTTLEVTTKLLKALNAKAAEVEAMVTTLESRVSAAQEFEAQAVRRAEAIAAQMEERVRERIEAALRDVDQVASTRKLEVERLESLVTRGEAMLKAVDDASERLEKVQTRAEHAVNTLQTGLDVANEAFENLLQQQDQIDEGLELAIDASERLSAHLSSEGEHIREIFAPLLEAQEHAEKVGTRLNARIEEARLLNETSRASVQNLRTIVGSAERVMSDLEPWRYALLNPGAGVNDLPPALLNIVDRFRSELGTDLAKMASAMSMIAQRAQTSLRAPGTPGAAPELIIRPRMGDGVPAIHAEPKSLGFVPSPTLDTGAGAD